eukprot:11600210-Alexandrium_andersonii.AAC.1
MHYERGKVGAQGGIYFRGAQGDRAMRDVGLVRDTHPVEPVGDLPRRWGCGAGVGMEELCTRIGR